jgi:hypothetical protein
MPARRFAARGAGRADRICRRAQVVRRDVRHRTGLPGRVGCLLGRARDLAGGGVRRERGVAGLHHFDLAPHPAPGQLDRVAGPVVLRLHLFEEVQHVLGALRRPEGH